MKIAKGREERKVRERERRESSKNKRVWQREINVVERGPDFLRGYADGGRRVEWSCKESRYFQRCYSARGRIERCRS